MGLAATVRHADNCEWHFDQYDWECTCGAVKKELMMSQSSKRIPGYYWVLYRFESSWEIAQWTGDYWIVIGSPVKRDDDAFGGIGGKVDGPSKDLKTAWAESRP